MSDSIGVRSPDRYDKYVVDSSNPMGDGSTIMIEKGPVAQGSYNDVVRPEVQASENNQTIYTNYDCEKGDE